MTITFVPSIAEMLAISTLLSGQQSSARDRRPKPKPRPADPKRAKVKAARKQRLKTR